MVLAHFREVGLLLCFDARFVPSTESLCDRLGRDLQVYLESLGKLPKDCYLYVSARRNSFVSRTFVCAR